MEGGEILFKMAVVLLENDFLSAVGGPGHANVLLSLIYKLVEDTETLVRETAVSAAIKIMKKLELGSVCIDDLIRMGSSKEFQTKLSACELIPSFMNLVDVSKQKSLVDIFEALSKDIVPMVRSCAARCLGEIYGSISAVKRDEYSAHFLCVARELMNDPDESVKFSAVKYCLMPFLSYDISNNCEVSLSQIRELWNIKGAWKIRQAIACQFDRIYGWPHLDKSSLLKLYFEMVSDPEAEVRKDAVRKIYAIYLKSEHTSYKNLFAEFTDMLNDPDPDVRCIAVSQTESFVVHENMVDMPYFPCIFETLKSLLSDPNQEVRNAVVSLFVNELANRIPEPEKSHLIREIYSSCMDENTPWRVVEIVVIAIPIAARSLLHNWANLAKGLDFFEYSLFHKVHSIRNAACRTVVELHDVFGIEWIVSNVHPLISKLAASNERYGFRISGLHAVSHLLKVKGNDLSFLKNIVYTLMSDCVPNVRIRAIYVLIEMFESHDSNDLRIDMRHKLKSTFPNEVDIDVIRCKDTALQLFSDSIL